MNSSSDYYYLRDTLKDLLLARSVKRGDFVLAQGLVSEGEGTRHTYSGIGIFHPGMFAGCEPGKFPLLPLLRRAIAERRLSGELHAGRWHDIGTIERLNALDAELRRSEPVS